MSARQFQFDWDESKAAANLGKHRLSCELASSVFNDPQILTIAGVEHGEGEERWFCVGLATNGAMLPVAYIWTEAEPALTKIRLISARRATATEIRYYLGSQ